MLGGKGGLDYGITQGIHRGHQMTKEGFKRVLRAILYWLYPQQGAIDALQKKVKAQEALIQTIRANRQSILNENAKLWAEIDKLRG